MGSPKAMEAEFDRACKLLASPVVTGPELVLAEEGLAGALALMIERRQFLTVAESYERLAACWSRRPQDVSALAGQQEAIRMAINAYLDAGKLDNAVALAKQMGDWVTAAKLLSQTGDKNREAEAWVKATTLRKPKPPIPDDLKERVEVQLAHGQFFEAAGILASLIMPICSRYIMMASSSARTSFFIQAVTVLPVWRILPRVKLGTHPSLVTVSASQSRWRISSRAMASISVRTSPGAGRSRGPCAPGALSRAAIA
jgi:hypothetical protein